MAMELLQLKSDITMIRICESGGICGINPFVTPTLLFIAAGNDENVLYAKNIKKRSNNISKIALVNDFSR